MSHKILIVEDEPNIVVPLQFLLEQKGYQIVVATSGEEALKMVSIVKPDLILLDIMLPGMDGYEVCENIRQNKDSQHTKIIFISALGREIDIVKGMALGADAYIVKPFSIMEITEKVKELLGADKF